MRRIRGRRCGGPVTSRLGRREPLGRPIQFPAVSKSVNGSRREIQRHQSAHGAGAARHGREGRLVTSTRGPQHATWYRSGYRDKTTRSGTITVYIAPLEDGSDGGYVTAALTARGSRFGARARVPARTGTAQGRRQEVVRSKGKGKGQKVRQRGAQAEGSGQGVRSKCEMSLGAVAIATTAFISVGRAAALPLYHIHGLFRRPTIPKTGSSTRWRACRWTWPTTWGARSGRHARAKEKPRAARPHRIHPAGNVRRGVGGPGCGIRVASSSTGIYVDPKGFVWIGGNGDNDHQILEVHARIRDADWPAGRARQRRHRQPESARRPCIHPPTNSGPWLMATATGG